MQIAYDQNINKLAIRINISTFYGMKLPSASTTVTALAANAWRCFTVVTNVTSFVGVVGSTTHHTKLDALKR